MDGQDGEVKKPLAVSALNNVAMVHPLGSKIPTPGSKLPTAHRFGMASANKRKASNDLQQDEEKKVKLNLSLSSDTSDSSVTSSTSTKSRGSSCKAPAVKKPAAPSRPQPGAVRKPAAAAAAPKRGPASTTIRGAAAKPPVGRPSSTSTRKPAAAPSATASSAAPAGKKRAAWDLKGRLQDMEKAMSMNNMQSSQLQVQIDTNNGRIHQLEGLNQQLEGAVATKERQTTEASEQIRNLRQKIQETEDDLAHSARQVTRLTSELQSRSSELDASRQEASGLRSTISTMTASQFGMKAELEATKINLDLALDAGRLKDKQIAELQASLANSRTNVRDLETAAREHEATRRKMHNTIQELKGNIRVFCRVRPLLGDETMANDGLIEHIRFPEDDKALELVKAPDASMSESRRGDNRHEFTFDRVFRPASTQSQVFEEISQLVQSALDGYNVCIFAYGQTGSGKTYTMEGPVTVTEAEEGMIPRSVSQIFSTAKELQEHGWKYNFEVSFLEIYNETIRDLLGNGKDETKHEIKMVGGNSKHEVYVSGLTLVKVSSEDKVHELLKKASENRAVGVTKCNERSSRSHSVFRLKLTGHNCHTDQKSNGVLNLIDLAGSERLKESGSQGARLKETQNINASLADLGNVIMALANKDPHIPYRNSKLTYLLQNSLGGNSKTLMFVNVSPKEDCFNETLNSLRFATKVNNCNIGTAQKRVAK